MSEPIKPTYHLLSPAEFNEEQGLFIDKIIETIAVISSQTDLILGAKDVNFSHFILTPAYAKLLENAGSGAEFDHADHQLLLQGDINKKVSLLNISQTSDGTRVLLFDKQLLKHMPTQAVLGIFFSARAIESDQLFTLIPNFILEFGSGISIEKYQGTPDLHHLRFSEYEHEVCYLMAMNWTCRQIVDFFNQYRPKAVPRGVDSIYKCRSRICEKLGMADCSPEDLRTRLIGMGLHRQMPQSFFNLILAGK